VNSQAKLKNMALLPLDKCSVLYDNTAMREQAKEKNRGMVIWKHRRKAYT
jgi:hypothetical protein